jgi:hypothetical protein
VSGVDRRALFRGRLGGARGVLQLSVLGLGVLGLGVLGLGVLGLGVPGLSVLGPGGSLLRGELFERGLGGR